MTRWLSTTLAPEVWVNALTPGGCSATMIRSSSAVTRTLRLCRGWPLRRTWWGLCFSLHRTWRVTYLDTISSLTGVSPSGDHAKQSERNSGSRTVSMVKVVHKDDLAVVGCPAWRRRASGAWLARTRSASYERVKVLGGKIVGCHRRWLCRSAIGARGMPRGYERGWSGYR